MTCFKFARQFSIRLAIFAMLMGALAPTISQTLRAKGSSGWSEICSALGVRLIAEDQTQPGNSKPGTLRMLEDCPYCMLQANSPSLPLSSTLDFFVPTAWVALPRLFLLAPRTPHAWIAAQPRAPPQLS